MTVKTKLQPITVMYEIEDVDGTVTTSAVRGVLLDDNTALIIDQECGGYALFADRVAPTGREGVYTYVGNTRLDEVRGVAPDLLEQLPDMTAVELLRALAAE
ncbi:hypothetical protein [Numidum massiliense]|uniref:hypothetical protein n=1 Tax=Numidum massiliense TaxID=1522315 RepID=UPI0006D56420|nr:hypothetical protein [Numidum massiliense]